eukprot:3736553-Pleurochrysis_carterae.AAC.2
MGQRRTEMGKQTRVAENEWGGGRIHRQGEGANSGEYGHICGVYERLWSGSGTADMGLHLEGIPTKVRTHKEGKGGKQPQRMKG